MSLAVPEETLPPSLMSAVLVTTFIVPPTDEIANLEDPNPLWTCIEVVTSESPAQLLQYTALFSMSLTGTPLINTAMLFWLNPRMFTLESPNPPPDFVA